MPIPCPHRGLPEWKSLESEFGPERAFVAWLRNGQEMPSVERARDLLEPRAQAAASDVPLSPSEQDAAYLKAAESGDTETAQKMVDEAAKKAALQKLHHGSDAENITNFRTEVSTANDGPAGAYFTPDKKYAGVFGENVTDHYVAAGRTLDLDNDQTPVGDFFAKLSNAVGVKLVNDGKRDTLGKAVEWITSRDRPDAVKIRNATTRILKKMGYDSAVRLDGDEVIAFAPSQIKSADPITRDVSGKIIPLSERFNPASNSILQAPESDVPRDTSSPKNADQAEVREKMGVPEREKPLNRAFGKFYAEAKAKLARDPKWGERLVTDNLFSPKPLTDTEVAGMAVELLRRELEFDAAANAMDEAKTPAEVASAGEEYMRAHEALYYAIEADERVGTANARGLNARRLVLNRAFNLVKMQRGIEKAQGGPLSEKQNGQIQELHDKIKDLEKKLQAVDDERAKLRSAESFRKAVADIKAAITPKKLISQQADELAAAAKKRLSALLKTPTAQAPVGDYDVAPIIGRHGAWMHPDGSTKKVDATYGHADVIESAIPGVKIKTPEDYSQAYEKGWARITNAPDKIYVTLGDRKLTKAQRSALEMVGISRGKPVEIDRGSRVESLYAPMQAPVPDDMRTDMAIVGASHILHGQDNFFNWHTAMQKEFPGLDFDEEMFAEAQEMHQQMIDAHQEAPTASRTEAIKALDPADGLSPSDIRSLALSHIEDGVDTLEELTKRLKADLEPKFPDITDREIHDAISGYGKTSFPNPDEDARMLSELAAQMRLLSQYEDVTAGKAPQKTGFQRGEQSDKVREMAKQVRELMKINGIETTDPAQQLKTALAAAKTRMRNLIADLNKRLTTGQKLIKAAPGVQYDDEAKAMRDEVNRLRAAVQATEGKATLTDEQRVERTLALLDGAISALEKNLKVGNLGEAWDKKPTTPETPEITERRARLAELRQQRRELRLAARLDLTPEQKALRMLKSRITKSTAEYERRKAQNDLSKKAKRETPLDAEALTLKADNIRARREYMEMVEKARLSQLSGPQKALHWLVKWNRFAKISGFTVIGKLFTAANGRFITTPTEHGIANLLSLAPGFKQIAAQSPRYYGGISSVEAKAYVEAYKGVFKNFGKRLKTGESDWETLYGELSKNHSEFKNIDKSWMDFMGHLHMILKSPAVEAEYFRSLEYGAEWAKSQGLDLSEPAVQLRLHVWAYLDSQRAKLMNPNMLVSGINSGIRRLEDNKEHPIVGRTLADIVRLFLPIMKIPTNYATEAFWYSPFGALGSILETSYHFYKGDLDKLTPEQANSIARHWGKALIGLAAVAVGYLMPDSFGGYYQQGEKRRPGDIKAGHMRIGGWDAPLWMSHTPLLEAFQFGATARRVAEAINHRTLEPTGSIGKGILKGGVGLADEIPFVRLPTELAKGDVTQTIGRFVKGVVVPQAVSKLTEAADPVKREPRTILEHVESGIPGLRKNVPPKIEKLPAIRSGRGGRRTTAVLPRGPAVASQFKRPAWANQS